MTSNIATNDVMAAACAQIFAMLALDTPKVITVLDDSPAKIASAMAQRGSRQLYKEFMARTIC